MKTQINILNGLRGVIAIVVVLFHLLQAYFPDNSNNPLHHAFLAVDFFFLMSGYVIGYAYDHRIQHLTIAQFMKIRLIRLQPLLVLGLFFGIIGYLFDPFVGNNQTVSTSLVIASFMLCFLMLPSSSLPNRSDETFSLNGATWSLSQEYLVNLLYAIIGKRISNKVLMLLVAFAALALLFVAKRFGNLHYGWGWSHIWVAPIRALFPFLAGLLMFRMNWKIKLKHAFPILSILLLVIFFLPKQRMNGLYESLCVILAFPLIIAVAVGSNVSKKMETFCDFLGQISYPIYILNNPFIYLYTHWVILQRPGPIVAVVSSIGFILFIFSLAIIANKNYDTPIRKWLTARTMGIKSKIQMAFKMA